jgi:hypothetical protein
MTETISSSSCERFSFPQQNSNDLISTQQQSNQANKDTNEARAQSMVQQPLGSLKIIHATGGRVRFRAAEGTDKEILETICQNLRQLNGVIEVLANQQTRSLVVSFDENKLSLPQMLAFMQEFSVTASASPQSDNKSDPFAVWKSLDFWKEQGISFIPLMTGLAVTGRLGIHGLVALPVYLVVADTTRWVIRSFPQTTIKTEQKSQEKAEKPDNEFVSFSQFSTQPSSKTAFNVVHAINGRIRFHVPRIADDRAYATRLERLLKTDPQVISVRVNCDAASIAISYKPGEIPVSYWVNLLELARDITPRTIPIKTTSEEQPLPQVSQSIAPQQSAIEVKANLWCDFKPPALWGTLTYMANFPLRL